MDEHAHRHDPDGIGRPEAGAARPWPAHDEPVTENRSIEHRRAVPPVAVHHPAEPFRRPGFWQSLTTIERAAFLASAQEVIYPAGAVLWSEGEAADHTIVIKSGSVRVFVERGGHERILAFRHPGDIIGERAGLLLQQRSATIIAVGSLHALRMTTQQFAIYLRDHPRVLAVMEREIYDRLTEQPVSAHDPQIVQYAPATPQYRAAQTYGPAAQYGPPQPRATVYASIPPQWPQDPYAVPGTDPMSGQPAYMAEPPAAAWQAPPVAANWQAHPAAIASPAGPAAPSWAGQNCTIVYTDIAGFSSRHRDETDRIEVRRAMYTALRESFEESRVPWDACYLEDRGDGALIVVPPEMPTSAVVDPMIAMLGMRLRRHNHRSSDAVRIQLRIAVDVGPVLPDPPGVSGWTIITAARLLDAAPLKDRLAATGADLGFIASRFVYESVIAHSPGHVNAADYEPVSCRVKETDIEGWIHLRGLPARSAF